MGTSLIPYWMPEAFKRVKALDTQPEELHVTTPFRKNKQRMGLFSNYVVQYYCHEHGGSTLYVERHNGSTVASNRNTQPNARPSNMFKRKLIGRKSRFWFFIHSNCRE